MRVAGIMSGTSLDGIDTAVVEIRGNKVTTLGHATVAYPEALRQRILAVSNAQCTTGDISRLNFELGTQYARAVMNTCRRNRIELTSLELVGCHGQTIYHQGKGLVPNTMQIGEASVIAEMLGLPVVSDFRTRDMAAGGQGAPLVPFVDLLLLASKKIHRVALNIGGIANITILPAGAQADDVKAFDTGPGNMVMDQLVERMSGGKERFDKNGAVGARGRVNRALLDELLKDDYFPAPPPKSAGREQYGSAFVDRLVGTGLPFPDLLATATVFTAATIASAIQWFGTRATEVIASGGGTHNRLLMSQLSAFLPECRVTTTAEFGIDPDAKEAIAFAVLAHRTWKRQSGNLPSATGARRPVILGKITLT
jgi:anhydro-N-acetylmuramic acid kinase